MSTAPLTPQEKTLLLGIARAALEHAVRGEALPALDLETLPTALREQGAAFVTLTVAGALRGCIGTLEAYQPLAADVQERAVSAALEDYRFAPVLPGELPRIQVEVSRLTEPVSLEYDTPEDLCAKLRPGQDGVVLVDGLHRATFLPQVWEKVPRPADFLDQLCLKMGALPGTWRTKHLAVRTYQVEEFHE